MKVFNGIVLPTLLAFCVVGYSEGTNCWLCYQARSNSDCLKRGFAKRCRPGEGCENEVRYSGHRITITKRCKQLEACSNEQYQNTQISNNRYQCGAGKKNSVCRCCCKSDYCNKNQLSCLEGGQPKCRFLFLPNGSTRCFGSADGISLRTHCHFNCRSGYEVKGAKSVTCMRRGSLAAWSAQLPKCRKRPTCARLYSHSISNGFVRCTGRTGIATVGTSCVFRCNPRYLLVNEKKKKSATNYAKTVCTMQRDVPTWSKKPPACIEEMCPVATNIDHGVATCSNFNKLGSVCGFVCFPGYDLIGENTITCGKRGGVKDWDIRPPICRPKPCPIDTFSKPLLKTECSHFNQFGSICSVTCVRGHYMMNPQTKTAISEYTPSCVVRGKGVAWSKPAPKCAPKKCPEIREPKDGTFKCTAGLRYTSRCTFDCPSPVHEIAGEKTIVCSDDGNQGSKLGVWSEPVPTCQYKKCPQISSETTNVRCSDGYVYKSTCIFFCKEGFHMLARDRQTIVNSKRPTKTTCSLIEGEVAWSDAPPKCEKRRCHEITSSGYEQMICSDTNMIGSKCSFSCYDGFEMAGRPNIECRIARKRKIMGKWTSPPPICKRRSCANIHYDTVSTDLTCTDDFKFESACTLGCNGGYYMRKSPGTPILDRLKTTCLYSPEGMTWSERATTCQPKTCEAIEDLLNGTMQCSKELIYRARCDFSCGRGYDLVGPQSVVCQDSDSLSSKGQWSSLAPTCDAKKCPTLESDPESTVAVCDKGMDYTSQCEVSCKPKHFMKNPETGATLWSVATTCKLNSLDQTFWDPEPYKCHPVTCKEIKNQVMLTSCTRGNKTNSRCTFSCPTGYDLVGNTTNKCKAIGKNDAQWNHPIPFCKVRTCVNLVTEEAVNKTCTMGSDFKSVCQFLCQRDRGLFMTEAKSDYIVATGITIARCDINARGLMHWTGKLPKCHIKYCLVQKNPIAGRMTCSDRYKYKSVCTYECNRGYRLIGSRSITCEEGTPHTPLGVWSADPPYCRRR